MHSLMEILGIRYPVLQASMAWLTNAELVSSVSNAGGLGVLGPNAGQYIPTHDPEEAAERMRKEIKKARQLTNNPFAINYLLPFPGTESVKYMMPLQKVCIEEEIKILITAGDINDEAKKTIFELKKFGFIIIHRDYSPTVESALFAESLGIDAYIVTGNEAGGLLPKYEISTLSLLPQISNNLHIPVIAAGGIVNKKTAQAVRCLGAQGVYVGTRFIMSNENPAHINTKNCIKYANSEDLIRISSPIGDYRSLVRYNHNIIPKQNEIINKSLQGFRVGMLEGRTDDGVVCVSEAVGTINNVLPAATIVKELSAPFSI